MHTNNFFIFRVMDRVILHCDLNNFYASVECLKDPQLKHVPLVVAGDPKARHGVVLAKNETAKAFGIKTGDVIRNAKDKVPNLVIVPPHFDEYADYSKRVFELYTDFTCYVEPFGPDECWLDCSGSVTLFGDGSVIADKIREKVKTETGLTVSIGVSFNKVFAKMGSDLKKPDATSVVTRENFRQLLWNLPTSEMLYVGRKTQEQLRKMNILTIGELARMDVSLLKSKFGLVGEKMWLNANGMDNEPVREYVKHRKIESVGHGMTTLKDITSLDEARGLVYYLSEMIATRMRGYGVRCSQVGVELRSNDLTHISRQAKLNAPTSATKEIAEGAFALLKEHWTGDPLRTITISVFGLSTIDSSTQASMFNINGDAVEEELDRVMDEIRTRYGKDSIRRAVLIGRDFIYDKTEAEDFLPFKR